MKVGDKIKKIYPFVGYVNKYTTLDGTEEADEGWAGGCKKDEGDFPYGPTYYCDSEGFIEYEILAIVEMPRKYQKRIIYRVTMIDPDLKERKSSKAHMVTEAKFKEWLEAIHSSYYADYEVCD